MSTGSTALAPRTAPALAVAGIAVSPAWDPLAFVAAAAEGPRMLLLRPDDDVALAGVGAALVVHADGPDRFAAAAAALATCPDDAIALGGFAFEDTLPLRGAWEGTPAMRWIVPRLALVRRNGAARLVAAASDARDLPALLDEGRRMLGAPMPSPASPPRRWRLAACHDPAHWTAAVDATLADIRNGLLAKLVLARAFALHASTPLDPLHVVARLRASQPGCTVFSVDLGTATFVGATPERLVRLEDGRVTTAALAGTAPRGATPRHDAALAAALAADPKERAEHALVVDDVRARLAPLCTALSVPDGPEILTTASLQHLYSPIAGRVRDGVHVLELAAALHPTPAIGGVPRAIAARVLPARERLVRGWYGGGIGWCGARGGEIAVAIRTALIRGRRALLHAGAGIVAGSTAAREIEETRLKLRPLLAALLEL